ncbi:MAG: sugar ABC transporter ATP-binding protein [Anaerolineae bacterium]
MSETSLLEMRGITKRFPGVLALDQVNFSVHKAEVHALVGENGAGKSTLIKILSGAYSADSGEIFFDGHPLELHNPRDAINTGINVVYQELMLAPHLSVAENILLGQQPRRNRFFIDWATTQARAQEVIQLLGIELNVRRSVRSLSVAQQQVVEIARALQRKSRLLVLDEPSAVLGKDNMEMLYGVIRRLKAQGIAVVYISHRLEEIFEIADRVTVLKDGALVETRPVSELDQDTLVRLMIGRQLSSVYPVSSRKAGKSVLRVENLSKAGVFEQINFEVHQGEILGIAGLVGSGRTDLGRVIFGADQPDSGRIYWSDKPIQFKSPQDALQHGVGLLPEDRKAQALFLNRPVVENLTIASIEQYRRFMFLNVRREDQSVRDLIKSVGIRTTGIRQLVRNLSGGNQQKVILGRWLGTGCRLLIFDEPTRGVDVGAKMEIYRLMDQLAVDGAAIIMISSEIPEILGMSNRILVMRQGRITGHFTQPEATEEAVMQAALVGGNHNGATAVVKA